MGKINSVIVLGAVAMPGQPARGGFQSSNLRLVSVLQKIGPAVSIVRYPEPNGSQVYKGVRYAAALPRILLTVLKRSGRSAAVHFTPYCKHFLPFELMLAAATRAKGARLTIDLRAGTQEVHYRKRGAVYRALYRKLLSLATVVSYEGQCYATFLREVTARKRAVWIPNFVAAATVRFRTDRPRGPMKLIYVGQVSEAKGVTAALRVLAELRKDRVDASLTLVGSADPAYLDKLRSAGLMTEAVTWTGPLCFDQVREKLDESHYFLFLSLFTGEGHSNALTEAMARGVVPVCSRHGFNEAVVGEAGLVFPDRDKAGEIARAMKQKWDAWLSLSQQASARVSANFSDRQIMRTLKDLYAF